MVTPGRARECRSWPITFASLMLTHKCVAVETGKTFLWQSMDSFAIFNCDFLLFLVEVRGRQRQSSANPSLPLTDWLMCRRLCPLQLVGEAVPSQKGCLLRGILTDFCLLNLLLMFCV